MDKISRTAMGGTSSHAYHCNGTRNRVPRATRSRKPPAPLTMRVNRPQLTGPSTSRENQNAIQRWQRFTAQEFWSSNQKRCGPRDGKGRNEVTGGRIKLEAFAGDEATCVSSRVCNSLIDCAGTGSLRAFRGRVWRTTVVLC